MSTYLDLPHRRMPVGRQYRWWPDAPTHGSNVRLEPEPIEQPVLERATPPPLGAVLIAATVLLALTAGALVSLLVLAGHVRGWLS